MPPLEIVLTTPNIKFPLEEGVRAQSVNVSITSPMVAYIENEDLRPKVTKWGGGSLMDEAT